jgi:Family of unknown function (DUF5317)
MGCRVFLLTFFAIGLLSVPLFGGRLGNLARLRLRLAWTLPATAVIQVVILEVVQNSVDHAILAVVHVLSYGLAAVFVVANRRLFGMWLMALGGGLNLLAIAANKGVMPADLGALERAGKSVKSEFDNSTYVADAKLSFLGDIFAVPKGLPLANVFSVGDAILTLGIVVMLHWVCGSRLIPAAVRERRPPPLAAGERGRRPVTSGAPGDDGGGHA